jgi:hypothetical protein
MVSYIYNVKTSDVPVAMILPVPHGDVRMVDTRENPTGDRLFGACKELFPVLVAKGYSMRNSNRATLPVMRCGSYESRLQGGRPCDEVMALLRTHYATKFAFLVSPSRTRTPSRPTAAFLCPRCIGTAALRTRSAPTGTMLSMHSGRRRERRLARLQTAPTRPPVLSYARCPGHAGHYYHLTF